MRGLALAVFFIAASGLAQMSETITVSVTNVDVVVRDRSGNPVRGLTKDDFTIVENGKKREITHFEEITTETEAPPRQLLVILDSSSLPPAGRHEMLDSMRTWLPEVLREKDQVLIASVNPTPKLLLAWSTNRRAIDAALDAAAHEAIVPIGRMERRLAETAVQDALRAGNTATEYDLVAIGHSYSHSVKRNTERVIGSIAALTNAFSHGPQKRIVILAGSGLPPRPGMEVWVQIDRILRTLPGVRGNAKPAVVGESAHYTVMESLNALAQTAKRRGVTIYAIDPERMLDDARGPLFDSAYSLRANELTGYNQLASATGGLVFPGADAKAALTDLAKDFDSYYTLGFRGGPKRGAVSVKTPKGRARSIVHADLATPDQLVEEAVVAHLINPPVSNDLGIELAADAPVFVDGRRRVKLNVLIPVERLKLVREGSDVVGGFHVYVTSGNERGQSTPVNKQSHTIRWPSKVMTDAAGRKMTYALNVTIDDEVNEISVGVLDQRSEKTGFEKLRIGG